MKDKNRIQKVKKAMQIIASVCAAEVFENGLDNPENCEYCPMEAVCIENNLDPCGWEGIEDESTGSV